jgi:aryl-alcohol dehydrogenase-like predicted oxidoreductase
MAYGLANRAGKPSAATVRAMLAAAAEAGATTIDTAAAYGESESVIGAVLAGDHELGARYWVITKLAPDVESNSASMGVAVAVRNAVDMSRRNLRQDRIPLLMLHRPGARLAFEGALWDSLRDLVAAGSVGALGVSVYSPEQAFDALADPAVSVIQIPLSVLDVRAAAAGVIDKCAERSVAVFARSVFMQGALVAPAVRPGAYPDRLAPYLESFREEAVRRGLSGAELALAYARSIDGIAGYVIGAETLEQVRDNVALFESAPLGAAERSDLEATIGMPDEDLADISRWK